MHTNMALGRKGNDGELLPVCGKSIMADNRIRFGVCYAVMIEQAVSSNDRDAV